MSDNYIYNPLDKLNLGKSVAEALLDRPAHPIGELPRIDGAGIYVIYYTGNFEPYAEIARANAQSLRWPIYIGKAVPSGARRGVSLFSAVGGPALHGRLADHRKSIQSVQDGSGNLRVEDFHIRHLIVDDIWIPLGESLLISRFKPVWNAYLDGFGNHTPGKGRFEGMRPLWDTLHPGREWAMRCGERPESVEGIAEGVRSFLRRNPPPEDPHMRFAP